MRLVVIESPYAPNDLYSVEDHELYVRLCMADCFRRGEAPYASHALYTQPHVLDDTKPAERKLGMQAGFEWGELADCRALYTDLGISNGMKESLTLPCNSLDWRTLPPDLMHTFQKIRNERKLARVLEGRPSPMVPTELPESHCKAMGSDFSTEQLFRKGPCLDPDKMNGACDQPWDFDLRPNEKDSLGE